MGATAPNSCAAPSRATLGRISRTKRSRKTSQAGSAPFIEGKTSLAAITADDLDKALKSLLPWDMLRRLDEEAPTHFMTPAGSRIALDYSTEGGPTLSVRVQELFGLASHPAIAKGRVPLDAGIAFAPGRAPIQITADLPGFWRGSWTAE